MALLLDLPDHAPLSLDTFYRDVEVFWGPDSKHVAFTDYQGSNVSDCFLASAHSSAHLISMTDKLPPLPKILTQGHFYVSCSGWKDRAHLKVLATGHTDTNPIRLFSYHFIFDSETGRMAWNDGSIDR